MSWTRWSTVASSKFCGISTLSESMNPLHKAAVVASKLNVDQYPLLQNEPKGLCTIKPNISRPTVQFHVGV